MNQTRRKVREITETYIKYSSQKIGVMCDFTGILSLGIMPVSCFGFHSFLVKPRSALADVK